MHNEETMLMRGVIETLALTWRIPESSGQKTHASGLDWKSLTEMLDATLRLEPSRKQPDLSDSANAVAASQWANT